MCGLVDNEWMVARDINRLVQTTQNLRRFTYGPVAATLQQVSNAGYITGNQPITISGDVDGTGTTAITLTLDAVNSNVGTFQGITVNGKGLVTAASNQSYLTANQTITLSGDLSGSGTTAINAQIAANAVGTAEIANANVTYAKIQNVANNRVLGNTSGAAAAPSEIVLPLSVVNGGTGSGTAAGALTGLGAVAKVGDTMTGTLNISPAAINATINFDTIVGASNGNAIFGRRGGLTRWDLILGYGAESAGTGSDFSISRYNDAGSWINYVLQLSRGTGNAVFTGTVTANGVLLTSDAGLKTDIEPLGEVLALVAAVEPKSWAWRDGDGSRHSGFVAQDLAGLEVPGIIAEPGEGMSADVGALLAVLWQAVRELSREVAALKGVVS